MPALPDARAPDVSLARRARQPDASCIRRSRASRPAARCASTRRRPRPESARPSASVPRSRRSASSTRTAVGPAAESATPAARIVPSAFSETCTAAAAVAKSPTLRSTFWYEPAVRSSGTGNSAASAISPSPTAVVKLSTRKSSIGTRRVPALPRTTTSARDASATAVQSPAGSLWHKLPTTVPIWRTTGSATTRDASWIRLQRRSPIHGARSMSLSRAIAPMAST